MKKITFSIAALAMAAMMFSSCLGDDEKEDDEIKNDISFLYIKAERTATDDGVTITKNPNWAINNNVFAKSTTKSSDNDEEATGFKGKITDLFKDAQRRTTIYGFEGDEFMSITYNGKDSKDISYQQEIGGSVPELLLEYLETGTLTEAMDGKFNFNALVIYKSAKDAGASGNNLWISTSCTVNPSSLKVKNVSYIQGTFTAKMKNKEGDTFMFIPGSFSCLGY